MFHVGAIIELIENDDLMNEEEEEVKFNKLSVVFHPKKEREKERKREKKERFYIIYGDAPLKSNKSVMK